MSRTYWLRTPHGAARQITPAGLLLGRAPSCDVVLPDPTASRRQVLVCLDEDGPAVIVMGRGRVTVDGAPVAERAPLAASSVLVVGDVSFTLEEEEVVHDGEPPLPIWFVKDPSGSLFAVSERTFSIGGGARDDLRVSGWAQRAMVLSPGRSGLDIAPTVEVEVDGETVGPGEIARARAGSVIAAEELTLVVVAGGMLGDDSTMAAPDAAVSSARLEFLPRGGRLHVGSGDHQVSLYLAERPCDFVAVLLSPPAPLRPGDAVPDEHVWSRVWGAQPAGRKTLNVLMHRLRRDLDRAGLDGARLIERAAGATRFVVAEGAMVTVE